MNAQIGDIIKETRKRNKITLKQLADITGVSVSYLSLLERNLNTPTVENLNKICSVLNLTLSDLITKAEHNSTVMIKPHQRKVIFSDKGYIYESAYDSNRKMNCIILTIKDEHVHISSPHMTDEIGYIVSGSIIMTVNGTEYELTAGDFMYIEANNHHSYRKISKEDCITVWFNISPSI